jgi:cell filamentation protein
MSMPGLDPYLYPGTNVLRNLADLHDQKSLDSFEADAVAASLVNLGRRPIQGPFDIRRLLETHQRIFGRVYPWAGELRKGVGLMAKERSGFVVSYGPSQNVPGALAATFAALKAEDELHGLDAAAMPKRLAYFYSELDAIHPFRDGNSRTLRAFTSDLAQAAGHRLEWAVAANAPEGKQKLYHARDLAVMRRDISELTAIIGAALLD